MNPLRHWRRLAMCLLPLLLSGCETVAYYSQAVGGQWQLWRQRQPIEQLLVDSRTDAQLKQRLSRVKAIRQFASERLLLPDNDSYRYYTDLERPYVVWNVVAAEAFSVQPVQWCFPIAGCVSYRGYFTEQAAMNYADKLAGQGYDTYVAGVAAYSTLGWFDDPLLNTFIDYDEIDLAGVIFHELAHQQLYIAGDTRFNESFARAVELAGIQLWLDSSQRGPQPEVDQQSVSLEDYLQAQRVNEAFISEMLAGRQRLAELYQQSDDREQLDSLKQQLLETIKGEYNQSFKQHWPQSAGFDPWVNSRVRHGELNNAKLASIAHYHHWLLAFQQLLAEQNHDLASFYRQVSALAELAQPQRDQILKNLNDRATSQAAMRHYKRSSSAKLNSSRRSRQLASQIKPMNLLGQYRETF
jgi:predicted aminopeptidase